jgi:hypothetical protein
MSLHNNPITNVTSKTKVSKLKVNISRPRKLIVEDRRSFLEMSMYRIKKYFNGTENN